MFWILQENFRDEHNYDGLLAQLERQGCRYAQVKMIPFGHTLEPDINPEGPVFVVGGTSLKHVAIKKGWSPGYFYQNINYDNLIAKYGTNMFNYGGLSSPVKDANPQWETFFVRPCNDGKQFSGTAMTLEEFRSWQSAIVAGGGAETSKTSIRPDDPIFMAPLKDIYAEFRFFVVDGKVITGSQYRRGGIIRYDAHVDQEISDFAQKMVDIWAPNDAFVLDVCTGPDGLKVMEINSINSAGFYDCDMGKFVDAIEVLVERKYSDKT